MNKGHRETVIAVLEGLLNEVNLSDVLDCMGVALKRVDRAAMNNMEGEPMRVYRAESERALYVLGVAHRDTKAMGL